MLMCRDLARIASDYIDGELGPGDRMSVRMHLLMCRHCRSFIGNLRTSMTLIQAHSDQIPSDDLIRKIDEEIEKALQKTGGED